MSGLDKVKALIGSVAPTLGAALGGPIGGIAGQFIKKALGVESEDAAMDLISGDPDALLKLRVANHEFEKWMREADIKEAALAGEDRKDARLLAKTNGMVPQVTLSGVYTIGYFCLIIGLLAGALQFPTSGAEQQLMAGLIGVMSAAQVQIMNFWFGSSLGSKQKTQQMAHT